MKRKSIYLLLIMLQQVFIQSEGSCVSEYYTEEIISNYRRVHVVTAVYTNCKYEMIYNPHKYSLQPDYDKNYQYGDSVYLHVTTAISSSLISKIQGDSFTGTSNIKTLLIDKSYVSEIVNGAFDDLENLKILKLPRNNLTILKDNTFSSLVNLELLEISNNAINTLETDAFAKLTRLETLDLTFNNLSKVNKAFNLLGSLKELDLSYNSLTTIESLTFQKDLISLNKINISNNKILTIGEEAFNDLKELSEVDLSNNLINKIDSRSFQRLDSINTMYLSNNNITELGAFKNLQSLIKLSLDNNSLVEIGKLDFHKHTQLIELNLRENRIRSVDVGSFAHLKILKRLDLSKNLLTSINTGTLSGLLELEYLNLSRNQINTLGFPFHNTPVLQKLDISRNKLKSFDPYVISQANRLDIQGNLISCSDLADLLKKLRTTNITLARGSMYGEISIHGIICEEDERVTKTDSMRKEIRQIFNESELALTSIDAKLEELIKNKSINEKILDLLNLNKNESLFEKREFAENQSRNEYFTELIVIMKNASIQDRENNGNLTKLMKESKCYLYILALTNFTVIVMLGIVVTIFMYFRNNGNVFRKNADTTSMNELNPVTYC